MKKIIFGITSLTFGGAEKVLIDIVNELKTEYRITIFTLYGKGELEKFLPDNVEIKRLYEKSYMEMSKLKQIWISIYLLLFKKHIYNKYIKENYNTEVAFLEGPITTLFAVKNAKAKKIAWVHTDISKIFGNTIKAKLKKYINRNVYKKYDKIVLVSKDAKEKFKKENPKIQDAKMEVIHNYINKENVIKRAEEETKLPFKEEEINFILVARLVEAKAIDRLIKIHSKLIKNKYAHHIYVVGDGPLRKSLEEQIEQEKVTDTFHLLGAKENPYPYIKNADYFCLLSYFEGYPTVLEEAKILNKFIIITDNASREVIKDYKNSIILENNEEAIYKGLKDIIENKEKYENKLENNKQYDNYKLIEKIKEILDK